MDTAVVAIMAFVMLGAAIWCWLVENMSDTEKEVKKSKKVNADGSKPLKNDLDMEE